MTFVLAPHLTSSLFFKRLVCYLMPYFSPLTNNLDHAEADIIETLASYGARTRSELLNVVQIIAYGMSGLELLAIAKGDTALSVSQHIRLRGCANNLNRSAHLAEKTLNNRLKCDLPTKSGILDEAPVNDTATAQTEEILHRIDTRIAAARAAANPTKHGKGSAIFDNLFAEMNPPLQPAPR